MGGVKAALGSWLYGFWFLKSAFCCAALYYIGKLCFKQLFLSFIITFLISQFIFRFQINLKYPCFVFGVILHKYIGIIKQYSSLISFISGIIFITMLLFWDADFWLFPMQKISIGLQDNIEYYYYIGYRIIIGLFGTLFFISLFIYIFSKIKLSNHIINIISFGQNTLGIYLLQTFLLEIILPEIMNLDYLNFILFNFIVTPVISFLILIICLTILNLLKKSTFLSLILLGKKAK